jgi:hypothetical protein
MKYSLKKIALYAEIFGGIAIVVSLIFVGIQFRDNTIATKSATANATNAMAVAWYSETGNSAQSSQLLWDYIKDPKNITSNAEKYQVTILLHGLFLAFQNSYYLAAEGTLDQDVNESLNAALRAVRNQPGFEEFWENRKSLFFKEYRDYVTSLLTSDSNVTEGIYTNLKDDKEEEIISD